MLVRVERVGIAGSRRYMKQGLVRRFVESLDVNTIIVSGGALGVDTWAEQAAKNLGMRVEVYLPDWDKHGKSAGFIRNGEIVANSDLIAAFWDGKSRGTMDTVRKAHKAGRSVLLFGPDGSIVRGE